MGDAKRAPFTKLSRFFDILLNMAYLPPYKRYQQLGWYGIKQRLGPWERTEQRLCVGMGAVPAERRCTAFQSSVSGEWRGRYGGLR